VNQVRPGLKWHGTTEITNNIQAAWILQSPNQKIPDRKTKCVIETHLNIKQNVIFDANLKPV
ncbi:hypothetical protein, partial [Bacteroides caccae]|uniref:hypothetical protein n=1 Tax=Bacteroides caccae TaxID=47678 RepID=UPI00359C9628